jgi:hypothetical protein
MHCDAHEPRERLVQTLSLGAMCTRHVHLAPHHVTPMHLSQNTHACTVTHVQLATTRRLLTALMVATIVSAA